MNREEAYLKMVSSAASMQWSIAFILQAKATEAEKQQAWVLNHVESRIFDSQQSQLNQSVQYHEMVLETIEGITKVNQSMVSILKAVLDKEEASEGFAGMEGGFGNNPAFGDRRR
ncbi:restriction endonuclease subunit S [Paenibacillus sp. 2TAB19]|uniref:restriction endonuclease subunit S n=1 Tax=Paenibacillus sp. 2TAB19 TaxID=3233003 RepID=UPI003F9C84F2